MTTVNAVDSTEDNTDTKPAQGGIFGPTFRPLTIGIVTLVLLVAFEGMAVTTAMPAAVRELDGLAFYAWGFSGFMVSSMFATVVSGQLADRLGPTVPLVGGISLFTVGLVVAGSAPFMWLFVLGRVIQGLGGGAIVVSLYVVAGRAYPAALLPRLFSVFSACWVLPSIIGPLIAGALTEHATWRLVFLGLVPFAVVPIVLVAPKLRSLPAVEPPARRAGRKRLALAAAIGIGLLQYAGQELRWWSLAVLAVGLVLLVPSLPRLLPPGTLRFRRGLPAVIGIRGLAAGAFFGANSFIPLMLTSHRHLSTTLAGVVLTIGALGWSTGSWWQGRPTMRRPRYQLVQIGTAFIASGLVVTTLTVLTAVPVWLAPVGGVLSGLGMGLTTSSLSVLLLEQSPVAEQGANSASGQMSDAMGQVILIGLGGVLFAVLNATLPATLVFGLIDLVMVAIAALGVTLARRAKPNVGVPA
ncbi:MFS transporter [Flindersiella endophytica]